MKNLDLETIKQRSIKIRELYHQLELTLHGSKWSVEEDALTFLTDAGLVGRHIMSHQGRWPVADSNAELKHKLGNTLIALE